METYQARVVREKEELDAKLVHLQHFVTSSEFSTVAQPEQERLKRQLRIMQDYSQVLGERIKSFG